LYIDNIKQKIQFETLQSYNKFYLFSLSMIIRVMPAKGALTKEKAVLVEGTTF
jgi:hypothetical protein